MPPKKSNGLVELKVVTAVLEEKFKSHQQIMGVKFDNQKKHFGDKFDTVAEKFDKGSKLMEKMNAEIQKNSRFREKIKIIVATIGSISGALSAFLVLFISKIKFFK